MNRSCRISILAAIAASLLACGAGTSTGGSTDADGGAHDGAATTPPIDGGADASLADSGGADAGASCTSCLTGSGSYMGSPRTWACHYDAPENQFDTADNAYADTYNTWIIRCVSADGATIVNLWLNAGAAPGVEDTTTADGFGIFMYSADPLDSRRYLQGGAPNQTQNHIAWSSVSPGHITGTFDGAWSNASDGNPYGEAHGTFHVAK